MVNALFMPRDLDEARAIMVDNPAALPLAGGTLLLGPAGQGRELYLVALEGLLPTGISRRAATLDSPAALELGAGTSLQDLADSQHCPAALRAAARQMANRNIRNRATLGGNIAGRKSCASLVPWLLAASATLELAGGRLVHLEDWLREPGGIILRVLVEDPSGGNPGTGWGSAALRWSRSACDIGLVGVAVRLRLDQGTIAEARVASGGLGPLPRRLPAVEAALAGFHLPVDWSAGAGREPPSPPAPAGAAPIAPSFAATESRLDRLQALAAAALAAGSGGSGVRAAPDSPTPRSDWRGGAALKSRQAAVLIARAVLVAAAEAAGEALP
jgi:CO/xanthine dehydrogenase FAD-binding subunit